MWSVVQTGDCSDGGEPEAPNARCKHSAVATPSGFIYLLGGRSGNLPLKDLWRFDPVENLWEEVHCRGNRPPCLQEHTMVAWKSNIYVFGGEVGFASTGETPLWILDTTIDMWRKHHLRGPSAPPQPRGRRGHSAVVFDDAMHIYGGYQDLRGSSNELWTFDFVSEQWLCQYPSPNGIHNSGDHNQQPPPRHNHSCVVHDASLWVYGGMTDLQTRSDFWKWDFAGQQWSRIRNQRGGPGEVQGHTAIAVMGFMYLFGGERGGILLNDLWRFHFAIEVWERIQAEGVMPNPRCRHVALANPLLGETFVGSETGRVRAWETDENVPANRRKVPPGVNKSVSMCFGQTEPVVAQEVPPGRRAFKFRVHPVRLCSKNTSSDEDDDDRRSDEYVASYNRQSAQVNISRRLRDRLSRSSRLVRSISSGNYSSVLQESLASFGGISVGGANSAVVGELERLVEETPPSLHRVRRPNIPLPKSHSSDAVLESDSEHSTPRHQGSVNPDLSYTQTRVRPLSESAKDCCCYHGNSLVGNGCAVCCHSSNGYDGPLATVRDVEEDDDNLVVVPGAIVDSPDRSPRAVSRGPLIDLGEPPPATLNTPCLEVGVKNHEPRMSSSSSMTHSASRSSGYQSSTTVANLDSTHFRDILEINDHDDEEERCVTTLLPHKDYAATLATESGASSYFQRKGRSTPDERGLLLELKTFTPTHLVSSSLPLEEVQNKKERARSWDRVSKRRETIVAPSTDELIQRRSWTKESHDDSGRSSVSQGLWLKSPGPKPKLEHHHWQLCMYMCGGREQGAPNVSRQNMVMWRLYV